MTSSPSARLPVSVLTGFLGSGKTTLLSRLVRHPAMARTACVINEFGEVGLDHLLVARSSENTVLLNSGCLCCTVRGDLVDTLRDLFLKRVRGEVPEFDRVVVETTGLADPAPVLHTLMADPLVAARYRLDGVIATVDAVHGATQLDAHPESVKQAAVADRLVLTKTDLADAAAVEDLRRRLGVLNPAAPVIAAAHGEVDPDRLFDAGLYNPATKSLDVQRWLRDEAYQDHGHGYHHHDVNRHDAHIAAFCLTVEEPLPWDRFVAFMEALTALGGTSLLRVKGLLNVQDNGRPVVIHGVQHLFHPPVELDGWPDDDRRSRIVFITRDLGREAVDTMFRTYLKDPEA